MRLKDNVPVWVKEKRRPTREELAEKHKADGGTVPTSTAANVLMSETDKAGEIIVKRYNQRADR